MASDLDDVTTPVGINLRALNSSCILDDIRQAQAVVEKSAQTNRALWEALSRDLHQRLPQTSAPILEMQLTSEGQPLGAPIVIDRTPAILGRLGLLVRSPEHTYWKAPIGAKFIDGI